MKWTLHLLSLELRKSFAYRVDFWMHFLSSSIMTLVIAYFLWKAIFDFRQVTSLGGYTFREMMFYYLLAPMITSMLRGKEMGFVSQDIYEGKLNRYLIYPISYFGTKWLEQLAVSLTVALQFFMAVGVYAMIFGIPGSIDFSPTSVLMGLTSVLAASLIYFFLGAIVEMLSFWVDQTWSLMILLRFAISFLGGGMIPLSLFPNEVQNLLLAFPFHLMISVPIRTMMGQLPFGEWSQYLFFSVAWVLVFYAGARIVWSRGLRTYSGVGI